MARALTGQRPVCPAADYDFVKNFLLQSFLLYNKIFSSVLFTFLFIQAQDYRGGRGVGGWKVSPALFQKLEKSTLTCGKNALIVVIYG